MSRSASATRAPEDVVAIFHCSFHPTRGNVIDWSMKASDELNLDGVEFSTLPSGLHVVDEDVVHITQGVHHGISVFRRRTTNETGMRGFRLESLGILVAQSSRPRPWRHLASLKDLSRTLANHWNVSHSQYAEEGRDWGLLKEWYLRRLFRRVGEEGKWVDWDEELASECPDHPALHLPHILRILGPSSLTLYKHVLARRRVLIYTHPAVEPACILARIASDICGEDDRPTVLGMVGINDCDKLNTESWRGNGWIACTTDAIFMEKPSLYDLVIDLTTARPARPALFVSRAAPATPRGPRHRLHPVRFTFSDVRLWSALERTLRADGGAAEPPRAGRWADAWRVYEDVCVVCAGMWLGGGGGAWRAGRDEEGARTPEDGGGPLARQVRTTRALLGIFHAHSDFLAERLEALLEDASPAPAALVLTPRDVMALELGVLSDLDARFLEWLAERNHKSGGRKVVVRRGWKDLLGVLLGFG